MADVSAPNPLRKYAVQKPKGRKWETLALLDDLNDGRVEFRTAVQQHGTGYVRLIQIDFQSPDALSDYDWHLIELHDPHGGKGRPKPTVIAGTERAAAGRRNEPQPRRTRTAGSATRGTASSKAPAAKAPFGPTRPVARADNKVPIPYATYVAAILFGALAVALWIVWFRI